MTDNTQIIDQYLQQELTGAEKIAFEQRLETDAELQQEFSIQKQISEAAKTAGIKAEFSKAFYKKILYKNIVRWSAIAGAVLICTLLYFNWHHWFGKQEHNIEIEKTSQQFIINTAQDTIIETPAGVVFAIPANAFKTDATSIQIEVETALTPAEIMKMGLSTTSNGELLQTAGMFSINGIANGDTLPMQKEIQVSVPAKEINPKMQLFKGEKDSAGNINWVSPKPVERRLRTYDITSLDFYPPDYIPTLKALGKDYRNKKYTDSLYYSFSGWPDYGRVPKFAATDTIKVEQETAPLNENKQGPNADQDGFLDSIPQSEYDETQNDYSGDIFYHPVHYEIDPAKIKAIWNKKFNNTFVATKEFEERMKYIIHGRCTDELLNLYLQNIDKPLYVTDEMILKEFGNPGGNATAEEMQFHTKLKEFVKRKDGGVAIATGMQQKLNEYFQNKYKAWQQASIATWQKYQDEIKELDKNADTKRRKQVIEEFVRKQVNFTEEFCANITDAYRQIGVKRTCNDTLPQPPSENYYNFNISNPGWYNLDVYVLEATSNRQSMVYTDPVSGKKAAVTYKECSIEVEGKVSFDKVFVYLLPGGLSSFQRMNLKGNIFKENLNMLLSYDAIAVAYKGTQAYYFKQEKIQPQHYLFKLTAVDEKNLNGILNSYDSQKKIDLIEEFKYQLFEQQETERKVNIQKNEEFRRVVAGSIFNCARRFAPQPGSVLPQGLKNNDMIYTPK